MTEEDLTVSSQWIANRIALILGNNSSKITRRINRAACLAVEEGMGSPMPDRDSYEMMLHGRGSLHRYLVADAVGLYVCDEIRDSLAAAHIEEPWKTLLTDLLDLGDSVQRRLIGDDWLPNADDIEWADSDVEADGDA